MKPVITNFIKKHKFKPVYEFTILRAGWEMDCAGYIVKDKRENHSLILTGHEIPYFGEKIYLKEKLLEYEKVINETKLALECL